ATAKKATLASLAWKIATPLAVVALAGAAIVVRSHRGASDDVASVSSSAAVERSPASVGTTGTDVAGARDASSHDANAAPVASSTTTSDASATSPARGALSRRGFEVSVRDRAGAPVAGARVEVRRVTAKLLARDTRFADYVSRLAPWKQF